MRKYFIGFLVGLLFGGSIVWAAERIVLVNGSGTEIGTAANPLYITN